MLTGNSLTGFVEAVPTRIFESSVPSDFLLAAQNGTEFMQKVPGFHPGWLFVYLLLLLGFFAWARVYYGNIMTQTVQASTNFQVAVRMFKDKSLLQIQLDNILYIIYFLSTAYFLYFIEEQLGLLPYGLKGGVLYLFNLGLLAGLFFTRTIVVNLTGSLFNQGSLYREYLYHIFIFNKLLGIYILPMLLFVVYTRGVLQDLFTWIALAGIGTVLVMRIVRGVVFSLRKDISLFYMFLYLCALEIVPLALLYRWLEGAL